MTNNEKKGIGHVCLDLHHCLGQMGFERGSNGVAQLLKWKQQDRATYLAMIRRLRYLLKARRRNKLYNTIQLAAWDD